MQKHVFVIWMNQPLTKLKFLCCFKIKVMLIMKSPEKPLQNLILAGSREACKKNNRSSPTEPQIAAEGIAISVSVYVWMVIVYEQVAPWMVVSATSV